MNSLQKFRKTYFPDIKSEQWYSWKWQLQNRIKTGDQLKTYLDVDADEAEALKSIPRGLPFAVTPYYMHQIQQVPEIRKTLIPHADENKVADGEMMDPLNEEALSPVRCIIHRYPDRVVLLVTQQCAVYCRYCTRGRLAGKPEESFHPDEVSKGIEYIRNHPAIRDVIISGGDPLLLENTTLEGIISEIRRIPHVELIRISSKIPASMPMRINESLIDILKTNQPLVLSVHINHPEEITEDFKRMAWMIADNGIMTGSQTVLLKGVNDTPETMSFLMKKLLQCRIRPYSLYQCDPIAGSSHFRTSIETGLNLIQSMRGYISGYAIPHYIVDPPGGGGKIALTPDSVLERTESGYWLNNWQNKPVFYPDPQ